MNTTIPKFPEYTPLKLEHKDILDKYFEANTYGISDLTFAMLFVWRKSYQARISVWKDCLSIVIEHPEIGLYSLVPLVTPGTPVKNDINGYISDVFNYFSKFDKKYHLCAVPEILVPSIKADEFNVREDPGNFDYVYLAEDLIGLRGKKFDGKRNKIKKCLAKYDCKYTAFSKELVPQAMKMLEEWCRIRKKCHEKALIYEMEAIKECLANYEDLKVKGGVIFIDNKIEALAFSDRLSPDTAVINFEKANPLIDGLYQVINQWHCKFGINEYKYVNREQDMNDPGLRKAKQSYHPVHMAKKYAVFP